MSILDVSVCPEAVAEQIARFVETVRLRSVVDDDRRQRARLRYQRSWPMRVARSPAADAPEQSVALYNGSEHGVAFLASFPATPGQMVYVRLFWHDDDCPRVPAIVRHVTLSGSKYLIGCEFAHVSEADRAFV